MPPVVWPPEREVPWPPTSFGKRRPVTLADNWTKLADEANYPAMDLIEFNFGTRVPETINWYLRHKVGCTVETDDGKNYRFGRKPSDTQFPLVVYFPPSGWRPYTADDNDEKARAFAIHTLLSYSASKIHFALYGDKIWPGDMATVAGYILTGKIYVRYSSSQGRRARYTPAVNGTVPANRLMLGFYSGGSNEKALVAHEATHALADIRRSSMDLIRSEAVGHTAQALWLLNAGLTFPPSSPNQAVMNAAWKVAIDISMAGKADEGKIIELYSALSKDPEYGSRPDPDWNGV